MEGSAELKNHILSLSMFRKYFSVSPILRKGSGEIHSSFKQGVAKECCSVFNVFAKYVAV